MSEPIYEYVKGQGWVVGQQEWVYAEGRCGRKFRIVKRKPELGEIYVYSSKMDLETVKEHVSSFRWDKAIVWTENHDSTRTAVTLELVEGPPVDERQ
jgi:hypothetical protein